MGTSKRKKLKPLKITCTSAECESGLHCFSPTPKMKRENKAGRCRKCEIDLVNWQRVHSLGTEDIEYVFQSLKHEKWRHYMWHVEIDPKAVNYARRKGRRELWEAVEKRVRKCIGPAKDLYDGMQTPREGSGNPIFYAQHATAACCRKCVAYWYGIDPNRALTDEEIGYFVKLLMRYLGERLPVLTENGEKVPPIRKK